MANRVFPKASGRELPENYSVEKTSAERTIAHLRETKALYAGRVSWVVQYNTVGDVPQLRISYFG